LGHFNDFWDLVILRLINLINSLIELILIKAHRNSYRSQFWHMYGGLTPDQVGTSNRADGGEGE